MTLAHFVAIGLFALLPHGARAASDNSDIAVQVDKVGDTIRVKVECPVNAPRAVAWEVLTDYNNMAKFISNLEESVVRLHLGNRMQVYQKGKASRGPLSFSFESLRDIELVPQIEVQSRMIKGDTMPAEFSTRIEQHNGAVRILHAGTYTPSMWVPPVIGPSLIEAETRKQYGQIRDEILRRAAAPGSK